MKILCISFIIIFFSTTINSQEKLINSLKDGNKIIFIRHAYAPGNGDPINFELNDCTTQRNLNNEGIIQSKKIGQLFSKNKIQIDRVFQVNGVDAKIQRSMLLTNILLLMHLILFMTPGFKNIKINKLKI